MENKVCQSCEWWLDSVPCQDKDCFPPHWLHWKLKGSRPPEEQLLSNPPMENKSCGNCFAVPEIDRNFASKEPCCSCGEYNNWKPIPTPLSEMLHNYKVNLITAYNNFKTNKIDAIEMDDLVISAEQQALTELGEIVERCLEKELEVKNSQMIGTIGFNEAIKISKTRLIQAGFIF